MSRLTRDGTAEPVWRDQILTVQYTHTQTQPLLIFIDPTPQRDRPIMRTTRDQGREARDRIGEGGGDPKNCKKSHNSCRHDVENGENSGGRRKT